MKRFLATVCATLWVLPSALYAQGLGASQLILTNSSGGGVILQPNPAASSAITYTLPADLTAGTPVTNARILQSDPSGNLSWLDPSALAWTLAGNAITGTEFLGTTNAQPLVIRTNNIERMRIDAAGNVGIGTSSPTHTLHVDGSARMTSLATGGAPQVVFSTSTGVLTTSGAGSVGEVLTWTSSGPQWAASQMEVASTIWGPTAATAAKPTAAAILISPLYIPARITVNQIRVRVTTALGAAGDVGVYDANGNLVLNGGAGSLSPPVGLKVITPAQPPANRTLNPGQYYVAITWNSTTGVVAGANLGIAGSIRRSGVINTGGGTVLPATISLASITETQFIYFVSLNQ
jgi:hypothetical protein